MGYEKYENLFMTMELGVVYQTPEGRVIDANPAAEKILGYSKAELCLMDQYSNWQAFKRDGKVFGGGEHPTMKAVSTKKPVRNVEMGLFNPVKKKQVWIRIDAVPEFKENANEAFRVYSTFSDISDQFETEQRLMQSENKFKALFENSPIGIAYHRMVYDESGTPIDYFFLDANENYVKLTGVDPRGKTVTEAFPGIENDPSDWIGTFARAGTYGETIRFQQYLEPNDRWYDAVGFQSSPDHFVAAFLEITEQKKKEIELERLKNELEQKVIERTSQLAEEKEKAEAASYAKSVFLANMSHELRTPLNAVLGYADILQTKETDSNKRQYLNTISYSGKMLLNLINDILDLSKIEAGKLELEYSAVSIESVFSEIKNLFAHKIKEKGLVLSTFVDNAIPRLLVMDESRLRQVMLNLVGNAVKFTQKGKIEIRCLPYIEKKRNLDEINLKIEVEDTGKGISQSDFDRIFNSFEQATNQNSNDYGGTGLGLAISKQFANLMNGDIRVSSKLGEGSVFTVYIRNVEPAVSAVSSAKDSTLLNPELVLFDQAHVLITDDINYNRELIANYLENYPFEIGFATNGEEAFEYIKKQRPDILLLDMKMPVMDGYKLSKLLKHNEQFKSMPVIAVTASSLKEDENAIREFCDGFLRKPVLKAELVTELTKFINYTLAENEIPKQVPDMIAPDKKALETIYFLAENGDMDGIIDYVTHIDELGEFAAFYEHIKKLANACAETNILDEVKRHLK